MAGCPQFSLQTWTLTDLRHPYLSVRSSAEGSKGGIEGWIFEFDAQELVELD